VINSSDILHGKVLIVDDQEVNVLLLERTLRGAGYVCIESTTDPNEVSEFHRKNRYDLILLDLQMPGMNGFQLMRMAFRRRCGTAAGFSCKTRWRYQIRFPEL
jgi:CheY-like chemotaxis protein